MSVVSYQLIWVTITSTLMWMWVRYLRLVKNSDRLHVQKITFKTNRSSSSHRCLIDINNYESVLQILINNMFFTSKQSTLYFSTVISRSLLVAKILSSTQFLMK